MTKEIDSLIEQKINEARGETLDIQIGGLIMVMMKEAVNLVAKRLNYPRGIDIREGVGMGRGTAHIIASGTTRSDLTWDLELGGWVEDNTGHVRFIGSVEYVPIGYAGYLKMRDQPIKIDETVGLSVTASTLADFLAGIMPS